MTTTESLGSIPTFFQNKDHVIKIGKNKLNTNKRYPHFFQSHFTAGDIQQFEEYITK